MQIVEFLSPDVRACFTELGDGTWEVEVSWMHNISDPVLLYRPTYLMARDDVLAWIDD